MLITDNIVTYNKYHHFSVRSFRPISCNSNTTRHFNTNLSLKTSFKITATPGVRRSVGTTITGLAQTG
jgi:hypothetical protein